ncbi:uncharacterized protein LOC119296076 isoform X2 [Triticum dicoccoides]|uniref:uncharacterized protein LOC119296076 isoform X2 n=1 Tax=Triticum dicoccoides TaxID=85692 RepID=UPI0018909430|nr:uncharacterized protein LOC119296076 isoform X2 [Triticum dicoccoides]
MRKPQEEASPHCEEAAEGGTQLCVAGRRRRRGADANQGGVSTRLRGWKGCAGINSVVLHEGNMLAYLVTSHLMSIGCLSVTREMKEGCNGICTRL